MNFKTFNLVCFACFLTFLTWIEIHKKVQVVKHIQDNYKYTPLYAKKFRYILLWPNSKYEPFSEMAAGQDEFLRLGCPMYNCFVTSNRTLLKDIRSFDFIVFMGRKLDFSYLPRPRAAYQIYIYFNMESSPNYPVEDPYFDDFFNWTATYRLTSDIPMPYIQIKDMKGNVVGPKIDMAWVLEDPVDDKVLPAGLLDNKSKAAAIFYSKCHSLSQREEVIAELQKELKRYKLELDVYGECGTYECPRIDEAFCNEMLSKEYYFYLSFENSFDVDYVTEKLLRAVQNNVVPVVYGGANYSRFLPPGSYLDASDMSAMTLADTMADLIRTPKKYLQYFWWKKYYTYHNPIASDNVCNICAAMNNETMFKRKKIYNNFRKWWNKNNYRYI